MSKKPLTVANLIEVTTQVGGTISTTIDEYTIVLSTDRTNVDLICGHRRGGLAPCVLELSVQDEIEVLVDFIFGKSIVRFDDGSSSGLSEDSIKMALHRILAVGDKQ